MRSTTCYSDARANQTLDQTAAIVQRYGESTRPPLISFTVRGIKDPLDGAARTE